MTLHRGLLTLAFSLLAAAAAVPVTQAVATRLSDLDRQQQARQWALSRDIGRDAVISGPVLKVPVVRGEGAPVPGAGEIDLHPANMTLSLRQTTQFEVVDGTATPWLQDEIEISAQFARLDDPALLRDGEALDWDGAYLSVPMPNPRTLRSGPDLAIGGSPVALERRTGPRGRHAYQSAPVGVPDAPVTMRMVMSDAGQVTTIFPTGWQTDIAMTTDSLLPDYADVPPQRAGWTWLGRRLEWSLDGSLSQGKVRRDGVVTAPRGGFLGITMSEPDGIGPAVVYSDRTVPAYTRYAVMIRLLPLVWLGASAALVAMRASGTARQARLFLVIAGGALCAVLLAPMIGNHAAWMAGAAAATIGTVVVFSGLGLARVFVLGVAVIVSWSALWRAPYQPQIADGVPLAAVVTHFMLPGLLTLGAGALVLAWVAARMRGPADRARV